jgi:hypothetical protein
MKEQKRRREVADLRKGGGEFLGFENDAAKTMLYKLGRLLQIFGLIVLPTAIAGNLAPEPQGIDLGTSLKLSALGVMVFGLGYLLQQKGRR